MPIMPFLLGVITGSVITYIVKDDSSKQLLEETGEKITSGASTLKETVSSKLKKAKESVEDVAEKTAEKADDTAKTA